MTKTIVREEWKPVVGWDGVYSVSTAGNVRRDVGGKSTRPGRRLGSTLGNTGYPSVTMRFNGVAEHHTVHSLVAAAFIGPRPPRHDINHKNGIKTDNRLCNLEYCTRQANVDHARKVLDVVPFGDRHANSKLTARKVRWFLKHVESAPVGWISLIARKWEVHRGVLYSIKAGTAWKHIHP